MPSGCKCAKVKTKFLSKFKWKCSNKQEDPDMQEPKQCERKNDVLEEGVTAQAGDILNRKSKSLEKQELLQEDCATDVTTKTTKVQETISLQVCEENNDGIEGQGEEKDGNVAPIGRLRRASTHIRNLLRPKDRRDAICDEMEKNIEPASGVSLRQYRKFLATSSVLQELKML